MSNARELAELSGSYGTGGFVGMKNRIINGAMMIDQRNAGGSVTPTNGQYTVDRFAFVMSQSSKFTAQQSSTAPAGFVKSLLITSSSAYSVLSTDQFMGYQPIEGLNVADLGWGAAGAATVTLSFWVRSSLTGTFGGALQNGGNTRSYPFTYTVNSANTWEQKTVTVAGDTTGTWATDNGVGIYLFLSLGAGSTYSGTAGSWAGANYKSATGATSLVGTSGATLYITGVQLEKGSTATSFDYRPYGTELALCQRYFYQNYIFSAGAWSNTTTIYTAFAYPVTMRSAPTATLISGGYADTTTGANAVTAMSSQLSTVSGISLFYTSTGGTAKSGGAVYQAVVSFNSEL